MANENLDKPERRIKYYYGNTDSLPGNAHPKKEKGTHGKKWNLKTELYDIINYGTGLIPGTTRWKYNIGGQIE